MRVVLAAIMLLMSPAVLAEEPDKYGRTPLHIAVEEGSLERVNALLVSGSNPNATDYRHMTPLHLLAWHETPEKIAPLLATGANIEARDDVGRTPLMLASYVKNAAMVEALLAVEASPHAVDMNGNTALHHFAREGKQFDGLSEVVKMLLEAGISTKTKNKLGQTPKDVAQQLHVPEWQAIWQKTMAH